MRGRSPIGRRGRARLVGSGAGRADRPRTSGPARAARAGLPARRWPLLLLLLLLPGCGVVRTITVTTDPPGALVWINDKEIGRSPAETEFVHYGTYDVRIELDGYEPVSTFGRADAPWWDTPGMDFFAELLPGKRRSRITWHYGLTPVLDAPEALLHRARDMREQATREAGEEEPGPAP